MTFRSRLSVKVQNDLEGKGQLRSLSKVALLVLRYTIGEYLMIIVETGRELLR